MYFGGFQSIDDIIGQFQIKESELEDAKILAAVYDGGSYDGSAMVVFRKDGKLWEVNGSHCSCNGLEDCWSPEETTYDALMFRIENGQMSTYVGDEFLKALVKGLIDEMFDREVLENV